MAHRSTSIIYCALHLPLIKTTNTAVDFPPPLDIINIPVLTHTKQKGKLR